jgi:hypothetical protein
MSGKQYIRLSANLVALQVPHMLHGVPYSVPAKY